MYNKVMLEDEVLMDISEDTVTPETLQKGITAHNAAGESIVGTMIPYSLLDFYPIGSIYISAIEVSPASIYGGTWEQIKDTFLLAAGDTYANGATGGETTHTLVEAEIPLMDGVFEWHGVANGSPIYHASGVFTEDTVITGKYKNGGTVTNAASSVGRLGFKYGGGEAHNNMPPYLAVYIWKRIA